MRWPHGRATVNPAAPEPWGTCDRCGVMVNYYTLSWQFEYRGLALQNIRLLVCPRCLDIPFPFNQPIIVPPDPEPVQDPRPAFWAQEEGQNQQPVDIDIQNVLATQGLGFILTEDGKEILIT